MKGRYTWKDQVDGQLGQTRLMDRQSRPDRLTDRTDQIDV